MDPILSTAVLSLVIGAVIAFVFFRSYLLKQRSEVQTIAKPDLHSDPKKHSKPPQHVSRKSHSKSHAHASDKTFALSNLANGPKQQTKLPPQIKWEHHKIHEKQAILTLTGSTATYGTADGSTIIASCSEGTDITLWHGRTGKVLGHVDTNQLKNNMATISPNGRFLAAAAFTADVKVWEIVYSKDGSVKEVSKAMQLKGHKAFRYHLDEDPKTLKVFPIPLQDSSGSTLHYDRLSLSPEGKILATTHGSTLQWLCMETGKVLDTAEKAHDGDITWISWSPKTIPLNEQVVVLATASVDKKVKLWAAPSVISS
ncbi:hypothetical protein GOBAR_DD11212 [Gossypium barbadense]|nr:hypothetical protein GOBAR_DD11212 [Gossypium barbadense]